MSNSKLRPRVAYSLLFVLLASVAMVSCAKGGGGVEGTYAHKEEGTITLASEGKGTWKQDGDDTPATFTWSGEAENITFTTDKGKANGGVKVVDGNLVIPPDMISGNDPVTFTRQ